MLYALFTNTKDLIVAETFAINITIGANTTYTATAIGLTDAVPDGYKPIAVYCAATGVNTVTCYQCRLGTGNVGVLQLRNWINSVQSISPLLTVISIRDI